MKQAKQNGLVRRSLAAVFVAMLLLVLMVVAVTAAAGDAAQAGPGAATNGVIYVNNAIDTPGDGTSWNEALKYLQDALAAASSGDEIWVAGRTGGGLVVYYPDEGNGQTDNAITATFQLTDGVAIYGGFAGTEDSREERDWRKYVTVLSGDIDQNDDITDPSGIVTDPNDIVGNNSYHVVTGSGVTETAMLDGFIITAGSANTSTVPHDRGGGLNSDEGGPTLTNLEFVGNRAYWRGGGMYIEDGDATLTNVAFKSNLVIYVIGNGGGMYNYTGSPTLTNVLFSGNLAYNGAGMANVGGNPVLTNLTASGNHATGIGGGLFNLSGVPQIRNSIFADNKDLTGTGTAHANIATSGDVFPTISYSLVQGSGGSGDEWDDGLGTDGGDNIDGTPRFYTPLKPADAPTAEGDLRIFWSSPAIDAGNNAWNETTEDLGGLPRKSDGNLDGTAVIDMGAHEAPKPYKIYLPLVSHQSAK